MPTTSDSSSPNPQQVRDGIAQHGWICVHIMAEEGEAPYSFTVGLFRTFSHPELIVFGLSSEAAHAIFSRAVEHIQQGTDLAHDPSPDLIEGIDCETRSVPVELYPRYVALCRQYYEGDRFPLLQIAWTSYR